VRVGQRLVRDRGTLHVPRVLAGEDVEEAQGHPKHGVRLPKEALNLPAALGKVGVELRWGPQQGEGAPPLVRVGGGAQRGGCGRFGGDEGGGGGEGGE